MISLFVFIEDALTLTVRPEEYMDQLVDYNIVKVYAVVRVIETNQFWSDEDDFTLVKPSLKVEAVGQLQVSLPEAEEANKIWESKIFKRLSVV